MAGRASVRVQHWIACLDRRVVAPAGPQNHYNLFSVGYRYLAPPETEFPWTIRHLDMFARFVGGTATRQFEVRVVWVDAPDRPQRVEVYGPLQVVFRPGDAVRNFVFRLRNIPIPGPGRYRLRLFEIGTRPSPLLATEYIEIGRQS
ncbi:MAG TPA: hypothetical protein VM597_40055 [Gemmataceae bacterium]|jgi:hypothetical protein|nr:hypothetical protein [Gemmataceae bacterium]